MCRFFNSWCLQSESCKISFIKRSMIVICYFKNVSYYSYYKVWLKYRAIIMLITDLIEFYVQIFQFLMFAVCTRSNKLYQKVDDRDVLFKNMCFASYYNVWLKYRAIIMLITDLIEFYVQIFKFLMFAVWTMWNQFYQKVDRWSWCVISKMCHTLAITKYDWNIGQLIWK